MLEQCKYCTRGRSNLPQISWNSQEATTGDVGNSFIEILHDYFLVQLNNTATRKDNNILDLAITNIPDLVKICEVWSPEEAEIFTDHNVINFDLLLHLKHPPKIKRTVYDYRRGDFTDLRLALESNSNLSGSISADGDINNDWSNWKNALLNTVSRHIPFTNIRSQNYVPWMNGAILRNIKKKNFLRRKLKKSKTPKHHLAAKVKELRSAIKKMLRDSRSKYINSVCADRNNNPKRFWSLFKLKSNVSNVPEKVSMARSDGVRTSVESPEAIATMFNSFFTSIFTKDQPNTETYELRTNDADHHVTTTTSLLEDTVRY